MHLVMDVTQPSGAVATHHCICSVTMFPETNQTTVNIESYLDGTCRDKGMTAMAGSSVTFIGLPDSTDNVTKWACSQLMLTPAWANAKAED